MERRYRHKDGRVFWARINYSLVRDLEGKPDYLIGIIEDIDEQKRSGERLAEQEAEYLLTLQQRVQERTHELEEANQRLQEEIEQRTKIEKELAEKAAEEAVAADRTRLARDLHDAVTQTLFSASLIAEVLPDLWEMDVDEAKRSTEELRQLTRGALAEMRTLLLELRPATLTQTRLSDLIKQLCEAFIGRSRLPITLNIEGDMRTSAGSAGGFLSNRPGKFEQCFQICTCHAGRCKSVHFFNLRCVLKYATTALASICPPANRQVLGCASCANAPKPLAQNSIFPARWAQGHALK